MPFNTERQIRVIRIFLTVFYGFLLPNPAVIRGIVISIDPYEPPHAIWLIVSSAVSLIWVILAIDATW